MLIKNKYEKRDAIRAMINKSLEKYGIDYEYIKENQTKIREKTGKEWFRVYTFDTPEEFTEWKKFCIEIMTKKLRPYNLSPSRAEQEFKTLNSVFGLTQTYLDVQEVGEP